jgi:transposase
MIPGVFDLPSLRALDSGMGSGAARIWLCVTPTDMRCGFDRLAQLAQAVTQQDPLGGHLFVFRGKRGDRIKLLYWDPSPGGYVLIYKRLEQGVFKLPSPSREEPARRSIELRPSELAMLLDGIDLSSVKRSRRYQRMPKMPSSGA